MKMKRSHKNFLYRFLSEKSIVNRLFKITPEETEERFQSLYGLSSHMAYKWYRNLLQELKKK